MGTAEHMMKEIQELRYDLRSGKISLELYAAQLAGISQFEKQQKILLQTYALGAKFGKHVFNRIAKTGLISDGEAIQITGMDIELEMVKCPEKSSVITRAECLDFSGSHMELCEGCDHKKITQNRLLQG